MNDDLIFGPAVRKAIEKHATRELDDVAKEMVKLFDNDPNWRTNPVWHRLCAEFKPLYDADYERRKRLRT